MSAPLSERHPQLMVPYVFTFGVVLYTNGERFHMPTEEIRAAIAAALPPGTGVGSVTCTNHGIFDYAREKKS